MFEFLPTPLDSVLPFLIVLTALVYVHELGHYLVARWSGVRVEVFSIGFGPELFGWTNRAGTRWKISAVPLGGYVKMFGEGDVVTGVDDTEEDRPMTEDEKKVSFHHKRLSQRTAIVSAGPLANFLFAAVLLAGIFAFLGSPTVLAGIGSVQPGSAADVAGLQKGDRIVMLDDQDITRFLELRDYVTVRADQPIRVTLIREGVEKVVTATPRPMADPTTGAVRGLLGVGHDPAQIDYERHNPAAALWMGTERTVMMTGQILSYVGEMLTGGRDSSELGGVLRIAKFSGDAAEGGLASLIFFMASLSINLGLINLFPIPVLDGGHLVFYGIEALRGRPLGVKAQEIGMKVGLALVLSLFIFATWNDVVYFIEQFIT